MFCKSNFKSCLKLKNCDENSPELQQFLRRRPKSLRFITFHRISNEISNFVAKFHNENCRFFQKIVFEKLEKVRKKIRARKNPF